MREKNNTNLEQMRELIERLTEADIAYYKNDAPIMTDLEYDRLTEELAALEHDTGLVLSGSPTQKVSGEILESLAEVRHPDEADIWSCANCDFSAEGKSFLVNTHS